jgi:hypothetical protein
MRLPRRYAVLCLPAAVLALPASASAAAFKDRVLTGRTAHAAQAPHGTTARYPTAGGQTIQVTATDPAIAQRYAALVGTFPHGAEISSLKMVVVPAADVDEQCGGHAGDGILACYSDSDQTMIVPDSQASGSDVSVDYVIAHEYGHHIAAHRSNAPLEALDFGPKRWSSYELVCANTVDGKLAPGDEGDNYRSNPGEAWAEAYARLIFPTEAWRFTSLLKPTGGSQLAAEADVLQPWTRRTTQTFTGTGTKSFKLPLTLDGAFTVQLDKPGYRLVVKSGGKVLSRTTGERIHYRIACRDRRTEDLTLSVLRRASTAKGPYALKASYAG